MSILAAEIEAGSEPNSTTSSPTHTAARPARSSIFSKLVDSDSDSDDDVVMQIPRGKLVSRLAQPAAESSSSEEEEEDDDPAAAYLRMKQQLMAGKRAQDGPKEAPVDNGNTNKPEVEISEEDEDNFPVQARRRPAPSSARRPTPPRSPIASSRHSSPGLFMTPTKSLARAASTEEDSDSDSVARGKNFAQRLARIRAERKAGQEKSRKEPRRRSQTHSNPADSGTDSDKDGEAGRRLTQQARPTRKASKKALEELTRENQRINRNMQLAHQAKTKKKFGVKDLFLKLGYAQEQEAPPSPATKDVAASSVPVSSDVEARQDTPPTSPPSHDEEPRNEGDAKENETAVMVEPEAPVIPPGKGKGRAVEYEHLPPKPYMSKSAPPVADQYTRVESAKPSEPVMIDLDSESDDGLTIVKTKNRLSVFDRLPQTKDAEPPSFLALRHLANLTSPGKQTRKGKATMNPTELQLSLMRKAREQAQRAQHEKIEELRRRGILVQTEEEREKEQLQIENMVERAREAALRLAKKEKEQSKKNGETGGGDLLSSDESEDEDYVASAEEDAGDDQEGEDPEEIELSGSEDEEADDELEGDNEAEETDDDKAQPDGLFDQEVSEDASEEEEQPEAAETMDTDTEDDESHRSRPQPVRRSRNVVLSDDEHEVENQTPQKPTAGSQAASTQVDEMAVFGFDKMKSPALGLTQMFAGTMANLEDSLPYNSESLEQDQDSLDFLRALPDTQPQASFAPGPETLVPNSQAGQSPSKEDNQFSLGINEFLQSSASLMHTQLSELPDPTQVDISTLSSRTLNEAQPPPSTIETAPITIAESPVVQRKGKLQRRRNLGVPLSDDENDSAGHAQPTTTAFDVMKKAAKQRPIDSFNKKTSWAKDVVEEQAEESEDEYAGLGGASDDDSAEEDEEVAKMIDESDVKVDERQLAAFYAEKERVENEKRINELYKDVMNGGLRRKRGNAFDLSDSEDEAQQKMRKKQLEFQKMRKALMADERIADIAQNPKQQAFLRALEDHDDDPDLEFLDAPVEGILADDSTPTEENDEISVPDSQTGISQLNVPVSHNPLKRKVPDSQEKENRPPPNMRRTAAKDGIVRKPMTLAEIQHSISDLIEEPNSIAESQYSDASSSEEEEAAAPRPASRKPTIDRLTLSRTASMEVNDAGSGKMAFMSATSAASLPGFRVPSLIRRATSLSTSSSTTNSRANTPSESTTVRRGGTTRSNIHAQAREAERRAAVQKAEERRKVSMKKKIGAARGKRSMLGSLDGGFE